MRYYLAIGMILMLSLLSCQNKNVDNNDRVVASVYGKNLYHSDLQDVVYEGMTPADSIMRVKAFIKEWVVKQLVIHQAEKNLDATELDFSKQLEDYRNSLIIYKYESQLFEQKLDTIVSDEEIANYISNNNLSPAFDNETVRYIILNIRKKALVERMNKSLYDKALKERTCVIY